jgi:hypothetical protein
LGPGTGSSAPSSSARVQEPGIGGRTLLLFGYYLFALSRIADGQGFHLITLIKQEISTSTVRGAGRLWSDSVARYPQRFEFPGRRSRRNNRHELNSVHQCSLPSYEDIRELHYLPQSIIALEIFSNDARNPLLAFPPNVRLVSTVYKRLLAKATALSYSVSQSVAGQKWDHLTN